ncbi:MAG: EF-Tu/IF-2/RF-3 family GTPase [Candidatus Marsarchaeota archaeon]|jgi:selenocysteine-specific translation elongation factor|nr:EF-Tu/IF-2/RF-3 family GTPase [Candidatus Marsarchaeota archaeon]
MDNLIVAMPNGIRLAEMLGKKGSENGLAFYNRHGDTKNIVMLAPHSIEDKYYAVPQSLILSELVVLDTGSLDAVFGDVVVACSMLGKPVVFTDANPVDKIINGLGLKHYVKNEGELLQFMLDFKPEGSGENQGVKVVIDRAFPVKGVGDVALGIVRSGTVKVHDILLHNSGKQVTIRHLQSQDVDIESAAAGTRIGIAMKGIESSEVKKGDTLSEKAIAYVKDFEAEMQFNKFAASAKGAKMRCEAVSDFSNVEATIEPLDGDVYRVSLAKAIPLDASSRLVFVREEKPRMFAISAALHI